MNLNSLDPFLPSGALTFIEKWLEDVNVVIQLKNERRTKLGDYRYQRDPQVHQISIGKNLAPEAFFFVLTHEIAHLKVHKKFGPKAKSHGSEWKFIFGEMLRESVEIYKESQKEIIQHAKKPRASVGADKNLFQKMFLKESQWGNMVENLTENQKFRIGKRVFQRGSKRKIRYICKELKTGRVFLVNGQAIVDEIINE